MFRIRSVRRRRILQVASMVVLLTAGWSASAAALPPLPPPPITLPTLTLPTVTVPPVTTAVVTTPPVTVPPVTTPTGTLPPQAPPRVQVVTTPPPPSNPSAPHSSTTGGFGATGAGQSAGGTRRVGRAETSRGQAPRLRLARDWISRLGPRGQRRTALVFVLPKPALVEVVVLQVAPVCRRVGRFRVRGHRGVNRIRLRTRVGRHLLAPGTYRVVARALTTGRTVGRARLVVVDRASEGGIRSARRANSCGSAPASASGSAQPPAGVLGGTAEPKQTTKPKPTRHRGVLGAKLLRDLFSPDSGVPLWVYALLALAIALLGAAAFLPKTEPAGLSASLLLGLAGAAILLGLTIAVALG